MVMTPPEYALNAMLPSRIVINAHKLAAACARAIINFTWEHACHSVPNITILQIASARNASHHAWNVLGSARVQLAPPVMYSIRTSV